MQIKLFIATTQRPFQSFMVLYYFQSLQIFSTLAFCLTWKFLYPHLFMKKSSLFLLIFWKKMNDSYDSIFIIFLGPKIKSFL